MALIQPILFILCGGFLVFYYFRTSRSLRLTHGAPMTLMADSANLLGGWFMIVIGMLTLLLDAPGLLPIGIVGLIGVIVGNGLTYLTNQE